MGVRVETLPFRCGNSYWKTIFQPGGKDRVSKRVFHKHLGNSRSGSHPREEESLGSGLEKTVFLFFSSSTNANHEKLTCLHSVIKLYSSLLKKSLEGSSIEPIHHAVTITEIAVEIGTPLSSFRPPAISISTAPPTTWTPKLVSNFTPTPEMLFTIGNIVLKKSGEINNMARSDWLFIIISYKQAPRGAMLTTAIS